MTRLRCRSDLSPLTDFGGWVKHNFHDVANAIGDATLGGKGF